MTTPWGPLGYITFKRTYARRIDENDPNSPTEEFDQTIDRVLKACRTQLKVGFTPEEEATARDIFLNLEGSVAGRFLWQLGTKTVSKLGLPSLQNCAACVVDSPRAFTWAMDLLMLGSGVGYNIQREYVYQLPKVRKAKIVRQDTNDADFIVPDSREGWVKLLENVLNAHFNTGKGFTYSTILVRSKGAPIKGFGGTASGPEELCWGMDEISKILNSRAGKKLRPIDCLDIMNIIGYIVVAGNVRRSAQVAIGDCDDIQFLNAKRWDLGNVPNWRAMSNNSVVCNDYSLLPEAFWEGYKGNGEPYGMFNLKLSREVGRLGDYSRPDSAAQCSNPCMEQTLSNFETCCLAEVFLPNIKTKERFLQVLQTLYRICKHSLTLPCSLPETEEVVHKNMRMGIGITGYLQASDEQKSWLSEGYDYLRAYDKEYSSTKGWPESIKLCTVKPSGTMSLLPNVTPGVHPAYAMRYLRRIRIAANSPLIDICRNHGYDVEPQINFDGSKDSNTMVVSFPVEMPEGTVCAKDLTAIAQLEYVKELQTNWSDNAVSVTVYYKPEELDGIRAWLKANYSNSLKAVSFLLHNEHGFKQAPYEEITKAQYDEYVARTKPITSGNIVSEESIDSMECAGGVCPLK